VVIVVVVVNPVVTLLLENLILKMHIRLPSTPVVLNVVGEGRHFNEGVVAVLVGEVRVVVVEDLEFGERLVERGGRVLEEAVLSDVCEEEVAVG